MQKTKTTTAGLMREYGLPESFKGSKRALRYSNPIEKGICWYWFAMYIRARDAERWGRCISCGKVKTFEQLQAGHFAPAGGSGIDLLMDEMNVHGECNDCNAFDQMHLLGYARNLNIRYGKGTAEALEARRMRGKTDTGKEPTKAEYLERASHYRKEVRRIIGTVDKVLT